MFTCRPIPGWLGNGDGNEVREEGRQQKKVKNSAPIFVKSLLTNPFSTTSRALAHEGAETQKWEKERKNSNIKTKCQTAIQSTRPACKHVECVRHQVVYMLKRMLPIRYHLGYTRGSKNRWSRTV